jgi:uncharacterized membrane protein YebE (DUF533 family)
MFDTKQLLGQLLGGANGGTGGASTGGMPGGGLAGGALAGGLAGLLAGTKTGRKIGKNALVYGGTALLGGLAYKAWQDWQQGKQATPGDSVAEIPEPPSDSPFLPDATDEPQLNRALLRAMIGAAKADGRIDDTEQARIMAHLDASDVDADDRAFVHMELGRPLDLEAIVADARCPETAAELYAASLIAIDPDRPAEGGYLAMLAARLGIAPELAEHLKATVAQAKAAARQP